jgi:entericidin B
MVVLTWRNIMIGKIFRLMLIFGYLTGLIACNTFEGMGKDVERGGESVQDAAKDVKRRM